MPSMDKVFMCWIAIFTVLLCAYAGALFANILAVNDDGLTEPEGGFTS